MAKEVERGKHISVLVEQAFPTCILVSYEDEGRTFRGVLLHETSHTVTRASVSKAIGNTESSSSLCLTAARAVTCESSEPASRVSTRSSTMMSQYQGDKPNVITPVHKIRGLVKMLSPRKRQATKVEDTPSPTEPQPQIQSPQQKNTLMKSLKRKRANTNPSTSPKLMKMKNEAEAQPLVNSKLPLSCGLSPLFPVLKLKRTAGTTNNYVAVSLHSEKDNHRYIEQNSVKSNDQNSGTSQDSISHKHNTRLKGRKKTGQNELESKKNPAVLIKQEEVLLSNGESLVEVYTKQTTSTPSLVDEETKGKVLTTRTNKTYAKRGLQPRSNNQEMRVGDIVWGKVHGHPWWPGRVLGILCNASENEAGFVKVAWYGSTTTSEISCGFLATFQDHFKQLFKKQKTGAYRRAVREAQQDIQVMSVDEQVLPV